jgi:hypothetical protein
VTEQIEIFEPEGNAYLFYLLAKVLHRQEARVIGAVGSAGAERVVVDELDAAREQEILEALEVLVRATRTARQK